MREDKKKNRAKEKKVEEEKKKKTDQEKAAANSVTIFPPSTNDAPVEDLDKDMSLNINEETTTQTDNWTKAEDDEALERLGISPNHLFGKEEAEETTVPNETHTVDLTVAGNFPAKKKNKSADVLRSVKESNQYTTKSFSITKTVHKYDHPRTYVEAAIALMKEDKPKEFIAAIKSLLVNGKILDPHFALAPLKRDVGTHPNSLQQRRTCRSTLRTSDSMPTPREIGFSRRRRIGKETTHPKKQVTGTMQPRRVSSAIWLCILQSRLQPTYRPVT
jgi:hypothetical protein